MDLDQTQPDDAPEPIRIGPFVLSECIGRGGMGEVWAGEHLRQGVEVAVKVITAQQARDPELRAGFRSEVRAAARMDHPGIVAVYEYGTIASETTERSQGALVEGSPFLVMELLTGGSLEAQPPPEGWRSLRVTLLELLDALAHAHARGLVHRDLKPKNVLFGGPGSPSPGLRLTDFGIAHALRRDDEQTTESEHALGTPFYMAPEQHHGRWRDHGPWTDLYALGCIAWELASGRRPFEGETLFSVVFGHLNREPEPLRPRFDLPPAFEDWARRLLEKAPPDRFQRAADAAFALRELDERRVWGIPPLPPTWRPPPRARRTRTSLVGVGLGLHGLRSIPVLGRDPQLNDCWKALREVYTTASPRLLLLNGEAGSGKSRLAESFCDRAEEVGGATSLRVSHGPMPTQGSGLRQVLSRSLGCQRLARRDLASRLAELLALDGVQDAYEAEALADYLAPPDEWGGEGEGRLRVADPRERNALLKRFLRRRASQRPLILLLDDVQWGGETLSLAEHLMGSPPASVGPVLLVLCARSEALAARPLEAQRLRELLALPTARHLAVPPLSDEQSLALVRDVLGLEPSLAEAVKARAGGRPQFAVQLVGDWIRRDLLAPGPDGFELDGELEALLPRDLDAIWDQRVQRVARESGDEVVASLEVGAALGLQVDVFEWNHACSDLSIRAAADVIDLLVQEGLAEATEGGWTFSSVLLRDALERSARSHQRWRDVHGACVSMLQRRYPPSRPGLARRLGTHLAEAGRAEEGAEQLQRAFDELMGLSEYRQAQEVARQREQVLARAGVAGSDPRWGQCLLGHANANLELGRLDEALAAGQKLEAAAADQGWPDLLASAVAVQGVVARLQGDVTEAVLQLRRALDEAPAEDCATRGRCLSYLASIQRQACEFERARTLYERARGYYQQAGHALGEAHCRLGAATVAQELGRLEDAESGFLELAHEFDGLGNLFGLAAAYNGLASVAHLRGDLRRAEEGFAKAWDLLERIGSPAAITTGLNVAFVHLLQEDWPGVERALHRIESRGATSSQRPWLGQMFVYRLPLRARAGDWPGFDRVLDQARELLGERAGSPQDIATAARIAGELCAAAGEPHRARAAYFIAREQWELLDEDAGILLIDGLLADLA